MSKEVVLNPISAQDCLGIIEEIAADEDLFGNVESMKKALGTIYKFAHVCRQPSCLHVHGDWVQELLEAAGKSSIDLKGH